MDVALCIECAAKAQRKRTLMIFSRLMCARWRLRCSVSGVTSRWIFGHLLCVLPSFSFVCRRGGDATFKHIGIRDQVCVAQEGHDHS